MDRAYHAVTLGDLERLIGDLPRANPPVRHQRARPQHHPARALLPLGAVALLAISAPMVLVVAAGIVLALGAAAIAIVFALGLALGPFILVALLIMAAARRHQRPPRRMHWDPHYY